MGNSQSSLTPDQRLALEQKLGLGVLAGLLAIFFAVLSARLGGFGWNEKKVEVNLGRTATSSDGVASAPASMHSSAAAVAAREPYAPPQVYLPPAPPPVVGHYPLPAQPIAPKVAAAPTTTSAPVPTPIGDRYAAAAPAAPKTVVAPPPPAMIVPPPAVIPATPSGREPGVAAIGLVAGTEPVTPIRTASPAALPAISPSNVVQLHVFAEGDNFWTIAQKAYGDGAYYRALFAYNQDRYSHLEDLRAGDKIDVPPLSELRNKFPQLCPPVGTVGSQ